MLKKDERLGDTADSTADSIGKYFDFEQFVHDEFNPQSKNKKDNEDSDDDEPTMLEQAWIDFHCNALREWKKKGKAIEKEIKAQEKKIEDQEKAVEKAEEKPGKVNEKKLEALKTELVKLEE